MRKSLLVSFLVILFGFISMGCGNEKITESVKEGQVPVASNSMDTSEISLSSSDSSEPLTSDEIAIPTLFIHGYKGSEGTFSGMVSRFEARSFGKKVLTITVQPDGSVSETGEWQEQTNNPLILVVFADSKNNEWNQADWIKAVLSYLNNMHQIDEVNLVGHSMGAVSSLRYLITYGSEGSLPTVNRFVAIGAPFNDFVTGNEEQTLDELNQNGPLVMSERYRDFAAGIQNYPKETTMLNIVGDIQDESEGDGIVPIKSGLAISHLMQTNGLEYRYEVITGLKAYHSQLHENTQVDALVADFLWDTP